MFTAHERGFLYKKLHDRTFITKVETAKDQQSLLQEENKWCWTVQAETYTRLPFYETMSCEWLCGL
jgi:hypothetical protein